MKAFLALGLCALLLAPAAAQNNADLARAHQAEQLIKRADALQRTAKWRDAAPLLQQAAELTPEDGALWNRAGWSHVDNNSPALALKAFENAKRLGAEEAPAGQLISQYLLGHKPEALALVAQLSPPDALSPATAAVEKGLAAKPQSADWSYGLGFLYAEVLRSLPRAVETLEALVKAAPSRADAWLLLVEVDQSLDRGPQEDAAAVKYLDLAPETEDAYRLRAERYVKLQKNQEAADEYAAAIAKYPLSATLHYQLARFQEKVGALKEAEATYQKLVTNAAGAGKDTLAQAARAQLAGFQIRRKRYNEAEKYYREAAKRAEATPGTWSVWGSLLALTGKWDEAAAALQTAAERAEKARGQSAPDELLLTRYRAAVCRLAAGKRDAAKTDLQAALPAKGAARSSPEMEARAFLAWMTSGDGVHPPLAYQKSDERWAVFTWRRQQLEEGEFEVKSGSSPSQLGWRAILQKVIADNPECWPAKYGLARVYAAGGLTSEAIQLLSQCGAARPDWWAIYYAAGQYYAGKGDRTQGVPILERAVFLAPDCKPARAYLNLLRTVKDDTKDEW